MRLQRKNNARSLITDNPLTDDALTVGVSVGTGDLFPSTGDFIMTLWDSVSYPDPSDDPNMEIVRGTARIGDSMSIIRAQEGTTAVEHPQGTCIAMLITAGSFDIVSSVELNDQCDGVNKVFTLPEFTEILILHGSQYPNVYSSADYTVLSSTQIELTAEVSAPGVGQTLKALILTV